MDKIDAVRKVLKAERETSAVDASPCDDGQCSLREEAEFVGFANVSATRYETCVPKFVCLFI